MKSPRRLPQSLKNVENAHLGSGFGGGRKQREPADGAHPLEDVPRVTQRSTGRFGRRSGRPSGALESSVVGAARSCREAEFLEVAHSVEMDKSSRDHQDVEQLVGVELEMADGGTL